MRAVEVPRLHFRLDVVNLQQLLGISEEEVGVGLQMDEASVLKKLTISLEEVSTGEALRNLLHLRIGEGKPNLTHLIRSEEALDELDVCAQEANILHARLQGFLCSCPHPSALDVNANEVLVRELFPQPDGVLAPAAAELKHDRVLVAEKRLVPLATKRELLLHSGSHRVFHHKRILGHLGKLGKLSLSHLLVKCKVCGADVLSVGKDINTIGAGTQSLSHVPIYRHALLFARIFDVLADAVLELAVLVIKGSALGEHIACRSRDADIEASHACSGRDVTGNSEANDELLDVLNLLGCLALLVMADSIDSRRVELACNRYLIGKRFVLSREIRDVLTGLLILCLASVA